MMSNMFKTFNAAAMFLMAAGFGCSGEAVFKKADEVVTVVKASTGYWVVKAVV